MKIMTQLPRTLHSLGTQDVGQARGPTLASSVQVSLLPPRASESAGLRAVKAGQGLPLWPLG